MQSESKATFCVGSCVWISLALFLAKWFLHDAQEIVFGWLAFDINMSFRLLVHTHDSELLVFTDFSFWLVKVMEVDLLSLDSVARFAEAWNARATPLHVLINNAGIFSIGGRYFICCWWILAYLLSIILNSESVTVPKYWFSILPLKKIKLFSSFSVTRLSGL